MGAAVIHFEVDADFAPDGFAAAGVAFFADEFIADPVGQRRQFAVHHVLEHLEQFGTAFLHPFVGGSDRETVLTAQGIRQGISWHLGFIVIGFPRDLLNIHFPILHI